MIFWIDRKAKVQRRIKLNRSVGLSNNLFVLYVTVINIILLFCRRNFPPFAELWKVKEEGRMNISIDGRIFETYDIDSRYLNEFFNSFLQIAVNSGLKLSTLVKIRFPFDYSEELIAFQKDNGLIEGHNGLGKTEVLIRRNKLEHYIFYHYALLLNLYLDNNEKNQALSLNGLYHELCHVHDDSIIYDLFGFLSFKLNNYLDTVLYEISLSIWSEYFAHLKSMQFFPINIEISDVKKELLSYEEEIKQINPQNKAKIYQVLHKYVEYLVRQIGNYHGGQLNEQELYNTIEGTVLHKYYNSISVALKELYDKYPDWNDFMILEELTRIIKSIWEDLGFVISRLGNDFFLIRNSNY
jgi:hypothetical protein